MHARSRSSRETVCPTSKPGGRSCSKHHVAPGPHGAHHFRCSLPASLRLPHTKALTRTQAHAVGKDHRRPFLLHQPMNPDPTKTTPVPRRRSRRRRSLPHSTASASSAAEQPLLPNQAKHSGSAPGESSPSPRQTHSRGLGRTPPAAACVSSRPPPAQVAAAGLGFPR